jgi:hypothetical protein
MSRLFRRGLGPRGGAGARTSAAALCKAPLRPNLGIALTLGCRRLGHSAEFAGKRGRRRYTLMSTLPPRLDARMERLSMFCCAASIMLPID